MLFCFLELSPDDLNNLKIMENCCFVLGPGVNLCQLDAHMHQAKSEFIVPIGIGRAISFDWQNWSKFPPFPKLKTVFAHNNHSVYRRIILIYGICFIYISMQCFIGIFRRDHQ